MLRVIAESTNLLTYTPSVFPVDSLSVTITDENGDTLDIAGSPVADEEAENYTLTIASSELDADLVDTWLTVTWSVEHDGTVLSDVERVAVVLTNSGWCHSA